MEAWKLQTAINDFTDACEADNHDIIRTAKKLRRTYDLLRNPAQQQDVLEQIFPLDVGGNAGRLHGSDLRG